MNTLPLPTQAWVVYEIVGMCSGFQWIGTEAHFRREQAECAQCSTLVDHPFEWGSGCLKFDPSQRSVAAQRAAARAAAVVEAKALNRGGLPSSEPNEGRLSLQNTECAKTAPVEPGEPSNKQSSERHSFCLKCILQHMVEASNAERWQCPRCWQLFDHEKLAAVDPWVRLALLAIVSCYRDSELSAPTFA